MTWKWIRLNSFPQSQCATCWEVAYANPREVVCFLKTKQKQYNKVNIVLNREQGKDKWVQVHVCHS
jgi:hypothetical protein